MDSLKLDVNWDLQLDANGSLLVADSAYSVAQNVATAIRTRLNDVYFNTTLGIDYTNIVLVKNPNLAVIRSRFKTVAESVSGVASATVALANNGGTLTGDITILTTLGDTVSVSLG